MRIAFATTVNSARRALGFAVIVNICVLCFDDMASSLGDQAVVDVLAGVPATAFRGADQLGRVELIICLCLVAMRGRAMMLSTRLRSRASWRRGLLNFV